MISYYVIDAFSKRLFHGNPAGVCILETPLSEQIMQQIAFENNLAETAFVFQEGKLLRLRWFTPKSEIDFQKLLQPIFPKLKQNLIGNRRRFIQVIRAQIIRLSFQTAILIHTMQEKKADSAFVWTIIYIVTLTAFIRTKLS